MGQAPMMEAADVPKGPIVISDVIGIERSINIFSGLTRDVSPVAERLEDQCQRTTVLAPGNSVLTGLGHRPWEDAADYSSLGAQAYEGSRGQDRAHDNLRRFVERHLVADAPWVEGRHVTTVAGSTLWWEKTKDGTMMIQPGNIKVARVAQRVANGEIWIIHDVVDPTSNSLASDPVIQ